MISKIHFGNSEITEHGQINLLWPWTGHFWLLWETGQHIAIGGGHCHVGVCWAVPMKRLGLNNVGGAWAWEVGNLWLWESGIHMCNLQVVNIMSFWHRICHRIVTFINALTVFFFPSLIDRNDQELTILFSFHYKNKLVLLY